MSAARDLIDLLSEREGLARRDASGRGTDADAFARAVAEIEDLRRIVADYRGMDVHDFMSHLGVTQVDVPTFSAPGQERTIAVDPRTLRFHAGSVPLMKPERL